MSMNYNSKIVATFMLTLACSLAASCSTEPAVQDGSSTIGQKKETSAPLDDIVVATEDEVPTWNGSVEKPERSAENGKSHQ